MRITSDHYSAAADRLDALAVSLESRIQTGPHNQAQWIDETAFEWAHQLRGAAEALAHHEDTIRATTDIRHEDAHQPCIAAADELMQATGAIWDYLDAIGSPAPHIRDRALDELKGCAATLRALPSW